MGDSEFFSKFLREYVARSRNAGAGEIVASRMARPQMLILIESSKITMKDGLVDRKER